MTGTGAYSTAAATYEPAVMMGRSRASTAAIETIAASVMMTAADRILSHTDAGTKSVRTQDPHAGDTTPSDRQFNTGGFTGEVHASEENEGMRESGLVAL